MNGLQPKAKIKKLTAENRKAKQKHEQQLLRLFPMRFDFELQICVFRSQKRMTLLMQSEYAKSDGKFVDLRIR